MVPGVQAVEPHLLRQQVVDITTHRLPVTDQFALVPEDELRPPRQTRTNRQDILVCVLVQGHEPGVLGPWSNQAHLPSQDVPQLGDLVDPLARKKGADTREPFVAGRCHGWPRRPHPHLPEFQDGQRIALTAHPQGSITHGSS